MSSDVGEVAWERGNRWQSGYSAAIRQSVIPGLSQDRRHDVRVVQGFAGQRRASATEAYRTNGLKELADALWRLHPLR